MNCIYIPRVDAYITEEDIKYVMHSYSIGCVKRVDFSPIGKTPGFKVPEKILHYKMAFVHFENYYDTQQAKDVIAALTEGIAYNVNFTGVIGDFWMLLPAKNPIPETTMNIHQVVENCRFLEKKVEEQSALIEKLLAQINTLVEKKTTKTALEKGADDDDDGWGELLQWGENWGNNQSLDLPLPEATKDDLEYENCPAEIEESEWALEKSNWSFSGLATDEVIEYLQSDIDDNSDTTSSMPSLVDIDEERETTSENDTQFRHKFTEDYCGNN